jgi:TolB protein
MNADGTGITLLTPGRRQDFDPSWSPNGDRIAYDAGPHTADYSDAVNLMRADGSNRRTLTDCSRDGCDTEGEPVWSPDGRTILFVWSTSTDDELRTIHPDGSGERVLFDCGGGCPFLANPSWSPDGKLITFDYAGKNTTVVEVMNADGTNLRRLRWGAMQLCCLAWKRTDAGRP